MKLNRYIKAVLWCAGVMAAAIFSLYLFTGSLVDPNEHVNEASENGLTNNIHDWEVGNWWVVEQVTNDSFISGVPGQSNTILVKYEVLSKNINATKKKLMNGNSAITYYVVRESYSVTADTYRDLFYMEKNEKNKFLYKIETHYVLRGDNTTDEEYYITDGITLAVVTPLMAKEMVGSNKRYEVQPTSYSREIGEKKHASGLDFGTLSKVTVYDGTTEVLLQLTDDSAPWPIYEKTNYVESELLDYSGWHILN